VAGLLRDVGDLAARARPQHDADREAPAHATVSRVLPSVSRASITAWAALATASRESSTSRAGSGGGPWATVARRDRSSSSPTPAKLPLAIPKLDSRPPGRSSVAAERPSSPP